MLTKRLKPGQLCTIKGAVFQSRKSNEEHVCRECEKENDTFCIMWDIEIPCFGSFFPKTYPKLLKKCRKKQ